MHLFIKTTERGIINNLLLFYTLGLRKLSLEVKSPVLSTQLNQIATIDTATKLREIEISGSQLKAIQQDVFSKIGIHTLPHCTISLKVPYSVIQCALLKKTSNPTFYYFQTEHRRKKFAP